MSASIFKEITQLVLWLSLAAIVGALLGNVGWMLFLVTLLVLISHLRKLRRLDEWLSLKKAVEPPESSGLWGNVFNRIYDLQKRNKRQKKKMALALTRFQKAAGAMPDGTVILHADGDIDWCNEAAKRLLGLRVPQDLGQPITNLIRSPAFNHYLNKGDFSEPLELPSPMDSQINLALRLVPYGDGQQLLLARDMTRVHRLEQMRKDFVANVSHELRTPLTVVAGYLEGMAHSEDNGMQKMRKQFEQMLGQTKRMSKIVSELLTLSRLETKPLPVMVQAADVASMIYEIRDEARLLSGDRHHKLIFQLDESLWLRGDRDELQSAFSNLVFNAIRYTPDNGTVTARWYADDKGAHFEVKDTGIGIAAEHIPRLTERFYRVDAARSRASGGTGLGLSIVKHVLSRHSAKLRIESEEGKGSVFACDFPLELAVYQEKRQLS